MRKAAYLKRLILNMSIAIAIFVCLTFVSCFARLQYHMNFEIGLPFTNYYQLFHYVERS